MKPEVSGQKSAARSQSGLCPLSSALCPELDLMSLHEVADEIGVSKSSVEEWVYAEQSLASFKKGKVRKVARADLVQFVLLNTVKPRRPDWLNPKLELEFRNLLRKMVKEEVAQDRWVDEQAARAEQARAVAA